MVGHSSQQIQLEMHAGATILLPIVGINAVGWSWLAAQSLGSLGVGVMLLRRRSRSSATVEHTRMMVR